MNYLTKESVQKRVQEHYDEMSKQGELFGVFLKGSQNYSDELNKKSDVDTVSVFMPTLKQVVLGEDAVDKSTYEFKNGEQSSRQDFRKFVKLFKKASSTHLECLYTEYFVVNEKYSSEFKEMIEMREEVARINETTMMKSLKGLSFRDEKQVFNSAKESPYVKKSLSHVVRLSKFAEAYVSGKEFGLCLKSTDGKYLQELKYGASLELEEVHSLMKEHQASMSSSMEKLGEHDREKEEKLQKKLDSFLFKTLESKFKQEM